VKAPGARMAADMAAQPDVLQRLAGRRGKVTAALRGAEPAGIVIVARGSSDYAAIFGRYLLEAATGRPVALAAPSLQTLYGVEPRVDGWLAIGISQSGRTPEIVTVLERYQRAGARTVAVTNDPGSPLAAGADVDLELGAGEEGAVPATKTFTAQLAAMAIVAEALGEVPWGNDDWERMPRIVGEVLADAGPAERAAESLGDTGELVAVGRGLLMCVALEAALKLREAAGVRAEGWSAADFRHGPVTVARGDLPLLAVSADGPAAADVEELAAELQGAGTPVLRLADRTNADLPYPAGLPEALCAIPASVRAHQLALAVALRRGLDPDEPPRLHKVTPTV
jgi:glucosamine--fructose-6-phosphate aminotransferase (isomerizing)